MGKYTNILFSEIFAEFDKKYNREGRLEILRKYGNDNVWFREFLNYAFNPKIRFDVTAIPEYKPSPDPAGLTISTLNNELRRLYIFIVGHPKRVGKLDPKKESRILYAMLISLHKDEAALLVNLLNKKLGVRYLTAKLVKEAFPDMPFEVEVAEEDPKPVQTNFEKIETGQKSAEIRVIPKMKKVK